MAIHTIAIIGGTGKEGTGLAYRWVKAGYQVIIGSRHLDKALETVKEILKLEGVSPSNISGAINKEALLNCDIAVITVPYRAHKEILSDLKNDLSGKILIDVTVPLNPPNIAKVQMPAEGSATLEAQKILGPQTQVVAAFQNIAYVNLLNNDYQDCDILVCGGDIAVREIVINLVKDIGITAWDAGPIENSVVVEGMTSILLGINKKYGVRSAGIKITGVEKI